MLSSNHLVRADTETRPSMAPARTDHLRPYLPLLSAATVWLTLVTRIPSLLRDADVYWHIEVGQWIVDHRAVPHVDLFSFTMRGAPWITSAWLSEVLYFVAFKLAGWVGPALLCALSASVAFFLLASLLLKRLPKRTRDGAGECRNRNDGVPHAGSAACPGLSVDGALGQRTGRGERSTTGAFTLVCPAHHALGKPSRQLHAGPGTDRAVRAGGALDRGQIRPRDGRAAMASIWRTGTCGRLHHSVWAGIDPGHISPFGPWGDPCNRRRVEAGARVRRTQPDRDMPDCRYRLRHVQRVQAALRSGCSRCSPSFGRPLPTCVMSTFARWLRRSSLPVPWPSTSHGFSSAERSSPRRGRRSSQ
ncbi:hypothetical protein ACVIYL_007699 [Bradyrhizobium sp. USDA 3315]